MEHSAGLIAIAAALFASTNVDDVFVLLAFVSDPRFKLRHVAFGQYLGIGALYGVSVAASLISLVIPPAYIGLLGLAPIGIGLKKLWDLRQRSRTTEWTSEGNGPALAGRGQIATVGAVTIANGGDNISIYTPLFATRSLWDVAVIGVVFAAMTGVWLGAAYWLTNHPTLGAPMRRYGHRIVPFVLIALGGLILYEANTIELLRRQET